MFLSPEQNQPVLHHKKTLSNRQCTSFHVTGCHFTGPVALRRRLSSALPIVLLQFLNLCRILSLLYSHILLHTRKIFPSVFSHYYLNKEKNTGINQMSFLSKRHWHKPALLLYSFMITAFVIRNWLPVPGMPVCSVRNGYILSCSHLPPDSQDKTG